MYKLKKNLSRYPGLYLLLKAPIYFIRSMLLVVSMAVNCAKIAVFKFNHFKSKVVIVAMTEMLGDVVATEPVARYLKNTIDQPKIIWIVNRKYHEVVAYNPNVDCLITVRYFAEWIIVKRLVEKYFRVYDLHIPEKNVPNCYSGLKLT